MIRAFWFLITLSWAGQAFAGVQFQNYTIGADARFTLDLVVDGAPIQFHGALRDGDKVDVQQGLVTATLKSYRPKDSFTSLIVQTEGQDLASVFLLETSANIRVLNKQPITDRKALVVSDLDGIIAKLAEPNGKHWDVGTTFQSMASYYSANPNKQLVQFFDNIELGNVQLAKPALAGGPGEGKTVQTPPVPNQPGLPPTAGQPEPGQPMQITPRPQPKQQYADQDSDEDYLAGVDPRDPRLQDPNFRQWLENRNYQMQAQRRRGQGVMPAPLPPPGYQQQPDGYANNGGYYNGQRNYGQRPPPLPPPGQGFPNIFQNMFGGPTYR